MNRRRYDDPIFGNPRNARQDVIDGSVEDDYGPDSVPRRTSQPPPSVRTPLTVCGREPTATEDIEHVC